MTSPSGREQPQAVHEDFTNIKRDPQNTKGAIGAPRAQTGVEALLGAVNDGGLKYHDPVV
ncbi:hypothetical protein Clacol_009668 [Clathrus columnatus]|uniref:Uncharacterized protein n=1 Tax=Clathrus columnatus TaxID=1419009 RepID=A0AAV5AL41_9AGAM|nr:hypothetical protein Clacol_009668 [Clathrus columnatus]